MLSWLSDVGADVLFADDMGPELKVESDDEVSRNKTNVWLPPGKNMERGGGKVKMVSDISKIHQASSSQECVHWTTCWWKQILQETESPYVGKTKMGQVEELVIKVLF